MWTFEIFAILVLILINSVFAGYEIALASVSLLRLQSLAEQGRTGAAAALRMKQHMEGSLAVVQLGITLVGMAAAATGGAGAEEAIEPQLRDWGLSGGLSQFVAIALVVAPLTVFTIIFGELAPKVFALRNKEKVCLKLSPPMEWFAYSVWPAVWVLENAVKLLMKWGQRRESGEADEAAMQDLRSAASVARMSRLIGHREEGIIVSASQLSSTPLRSIMLPSAYIGMLSVEQSLADALLSAHQEMHTRFPISEEKGNPQKIIGYVTFKDLVAALRTAPRDPSLRNLARQLRRFDAEMSVADCLEHLIRERNHIALVQEHDGSVIGMVTLEDVVEELVGEIHDEFDRIPSHLSRVGQGWIAGGFVGLTHLRTVTGFELPPDSEKPIYTLSDWIVERLEHPPRGGDIVNENSYRVVVRKTRGVLVQEALLLSLADQGSNSAKHDGVSNE